MPATISKSSSATYGMQGNFGLTDGKDALHHVLSEVLCQPWCGPLVEALERSGFNEIQDVLLLNQAERDMLTFLHANNFITLLLQVLKNMLLDVELFSCYCEDNDEPIIDWMQVTNAQFDWFRSSAGACFEGHEKVTIPSKVPPITVFAHDTVHETINDLKPSTSSSFAKEAESDAIMPSTTGICKQTPPSPMSIALCQ